MKKKPPTTEAIRRGFSILGLMQPNTSLTIGQIHSKLLDKGFSISLRTVERDMQLLPEVFPERVRVIDLSKPYGYRLPRDHRKYSGMSPEEAVCLQLAFDYLTPLLPNRSLDPIAPYLREAENVLEETQSTKMQKWKSKVLTQYEGLQLKPATIDSEILSDMHLALWEGRTIKVSYLSKNQTKPKDYVLHPGGLVYRGRVSYLVGSFEGNPENIIYLPLHRFKKISVLDDFSVHEDKDIRTLTEGLLGFKVNPNKINLELKFSKFAGTHLYESPLSDTQKITSTKDGYLKVKDAVTDDMELRFWIRGFGDEVEVLKPKSLRQEFASMSKLMNKKYEND
jgi:predicted DNA-binding transcriptional regulator YafY